MTKKNGNGADPGPDHNDPDGLKAKQEKEALTIVHISRLRAQENKKVEAKAHLDAETAVFTDLMRLAKAETGYTRKELQALLDDMRANRHDLFLAEQRRADLRRLVDLPVGSQMELDFNRTPVEVQDEAHARGMGYATGLRGDACEMPDTIQPRHAQAWLQGWHEGQEKLAWALAESGRIVDRRPGASGRGHDHTEGGKRAVAEQPAA